MRLLVVVATLFYLVVPAQGSSLIGDDVTCAVTGQIPECYQDSAVVGPGVEDVLSNYRPDGTQFFNVDFRTNDVLFTSLTSGATTVTNSPTIVSLIDTTNEFTSASLISSDLYGFSSSNVSLVNGVLLVNLTGTGQDYGDTIDIALDTTPVTPPVLVTPEPSTFALLGTGLLGVVGCVRKRFE